MALTRLLDLTADFNDDANAQIDISGWDWIVVQLVSPTGTVTFKSTNDSGAIEGTTDGNSKSAINWIAVRGTNLNTGTDGTTLAASGLMRFAVVGKFMQFSGTDITTTKLLVYLFKIS